MSRRQDSGRPRVTVLGAGSWGTTFGKILADGGAHVTMWARRPELAHEISEAKRNSQYLPGFNLPREMTATLHLAEELDGAEQVYLSIPSQAVRQNLKALRPLVAKTDVPIVSLMKGVERRTGLRMSQVIEQELHCDPARIAVASGPNLALEIAREQPTAAVISSTSEETADAVARRARNRYFRTFVNTDVIGTEFGGVLKNLIAVAIGIVDGVGYGEGVPQQLHVVTHLLSMTYRRRVRLEVALDFDDPHVPSVVDTYPTADWHERETWDFFGIIFDGHPALTRILMPDDWPGHPQRKDYPLGGIPVEYKGGTVPPPDQRRAYN